MCDVLVSAQSIYVVCPRCIISPLRESRCAVVRRAYLVVFRVSELQLNRIEPSLLIQTSRCDGPGIREQLSRLPSSQVSVERR